MLGLENEDGRLGYDSTETKGNQASDMASLGTVSTSSFLRNNHDSVDHSRDALVDMLDWIEH